MAYKSKFTGAKVDELLTAVQTQQKNPSSILNNLTEKNILDKLTGQGIIDKINSVSTEKNILDKLTGQGIIDKINSVSGNIVFKKYVDCQSGAGKTS